jgi:uncharacterized membrane protein
MGGPSGPPAGTSADVGAAFSWAFGAFGKGAGMWIGLAAVVVVVQFLNFTTQITVNNDGLRALFGVFFGVLAFLASVGLYRAALRRTRGTPPSFDALVSGENLVPYLLTVLVVGLLVSISALLPLLFLVSLAATFFLQFAGFRALDRGDSVGDALGGSVKMVLSAPLAALLLLVVNFVALVLSVLLCGLGGLVLLPIATLITAHVYRQLLGEPVAP